MALLPLSTQANITRKLAAILYLRNQNTPCLVCSTDNNLCLIPDMSSGIYFSNEIDSCLTPDMSLSIHLSVKLTNVLYHILY